MALINCPDCGKEVSSSAPACPYCGKPIAYVPPQPVQSPTTPPPAPQAMPPKTWLLESILATLLCCLPFGIVGIIYASRVESNWYAGNTELAMQSAKSAKTWTLVSFWIGILGGLIYVLLMALGVVASILDM